MGTPAAGVAVVTGAAGDIGGAVARLLYDEGYEIGLIDVAEEPLSKVAAELDARYAVADLSDGDAAVAAVEAVLDGRVPAALANVAGMNTRAPLLELTDAAWAKVEAVNSRGSFIVLREVARRMVDAGVPGSIVNITSISAWQPFAGIAHYGAAKAAVIGLTRSAALELSGHGVRVNAVAPGVVATQLTAPTMADPDKRESRLIRIPLGRFGSVDDIAAAVQFLLSDRASFITGEVLTVDGGQSLT